MDRIVIRGAGLATFLLLALMPQNGQAQDRALIAEGAREYGAMCARCHNPRSPLERGDRDWVTIVNHMRVRANLTGQQFRAVLAFLQATNVDPAQRTELPEQAAAAPAAERPAATGAPPSSDPQMIARGRELAAEKACVGCHEIGREGGKIGPSLNGLLKRREPDYVRQKLADPTFDKSTSMMPNFGLTSESIEALLAYLAELNGYE